MPVEMLTGLGLAIGYIVSGAINTKKNIDYQKTRDKASLKQQEDNAKQQREIANDNISLQRELAETQRLSIIESNRNNVDYHNKTNQLTNTSPIRYPTNEFNKINNSNIINCFIVPPEQLTVRGHVTDSSWDKIHTNDLVDSIRVFAQNFYGSNTERPIAVFEPDILNNNGVRGNNAIRLLQQELTSNPTLWIEANRVNSSECSLGIGICGKEYLDSSFYSIGRVPNYGLSENNSLSMAESIMFKKQFNNNTDFSKFYSQAGNNEIQQALERYELTSKNNKSTNPDNNHLYETNAIEYLSEAYKILMASCADMHYLKHGVMPLLPRLINNDAIFNLSDPYVKAATRLVLNTYIQESIRMSEMLPTQAPIIWLGIAETALGIDEQKAAKDAVLQSIKYFSLVHKIAIPENNQDFANAYAKLSPMLDVSINKRFKEISKLEGLSFLLEQASNNTNNGQKQASDNQTPAWLDDEIKALAENTKNYFRT